MGEKKKKREKKSNGEEQAKRLKETYTMACKRQWLEENEEEAQRRTENDTIKKCVLECAKNGP